jgi:hypothetical protein
MQLLKPKRGGTPPNRNLNGTGDIFVAWKDLGRKLGEDCTREVATAVMHVGMTAAQAFFRGHSLGLSWLHSTSVIAKDVSRTSWGRFDVLHYVITTG